jgi:hypothetical protein
MLTLSAQFLAQSSFALDWMRFKNQADNLKNVQQGILDKILSDHPYLKSKEDFENSPISDYGQQTKKLNEANFIAKRYQPTSGSGDKEKLIPYNDKFINELNKGLNPWLFDLGKTYPSILTGRHYWSISWLPTHYREKNWSLDDFELLPAWKKNLTRIMMAVPNEISKAKSLEASQFATLTYLIAADDLSFISVWSPTFFLQLLALADSWKEELLRTLRSGTWNLFSPELDYLSCPQSPKQALAFEKGDLKKVWPKLSLVSSWDSSTSDQWSEKLRAKFPDASFQGKGLWATEGVVTIPFEGRYLLSYLSHYYEFLNLENGELLSSWELKEGMEVQPVITSGNGFVRYNLKDRILVKGFYKSLPELEFLERDSTFDMVGEKLDAHCFLEIHHEMKHVFPMLSWVIAFAVIPTSGRPYYHFIFDGEGDVKKAEEYLKKLLDQRFHYHLALELGQLSNLKITISRSTYTQYEEFQIKKGMVQGNIKVELATYIKTRPHEALYHEIFSH